MKRQRRDLFGDFSRCFCGGLFLLLYLDILFHIAIMFLTVHVTLLFTSCCAG